MEALPRRPFAALPALKIFSAAFNGCEEISLIVLCANQYDTAATATTATAERVVRSRSADRLEHSRAVYRSGLDDEQTAATAAAAHGKAAVAVGAGATAAAAGNRAPRRVLLSD